MYFNITCDKNINYYIFEEKFLLSLAIECRFNLSTVPFFEKKMEELSNNPIIKKYELLLPSYFHFTAQIHINKLISWIICYL